MRNSFRVKEKFEVWILAGMAKGCNISWYILHWEMIKLNVVYVDGSSQGMGCSDRISYNNCNAVEASN